MRGTVSGLRPCNVCNVPVTVSWNLSLVCAPRAALLGSPPLAPRAVFVVFVQRVLALRCLCLPPSVRVVARTRFPVSCIVILSAVCSIGKEPSANSLTT